MQRYIHLAMTLAIGLGIGLARASEVASPDAFTSKATGAITVSPARHSPVFAEFERSPALTARLGAALSAIGFEVTNDRSAARSTLTLRGEIAVFGGPVFHRGVKVAVGDATERALSAASSAVTRADVVQAASGLALNTAAMQSAITPFWRGLAASGLASSLGEATGMTASLNRALVGDPRGICLSRCQDWNKVSQAVYVSMVLQAGDQRQDVRVLTKVSSDAIVVEELLDRALSHALAAVTVLEEPIGSAK